MCRRHSFLTVLVGLIAAMLSACSASPQQVTALGDDLSPLRSAFNDDSDRWRVLALVSPTCSECVLGAEAVEKEITARYPAQQVPALIVWIPMLPTDNEPAARGSATIFPPERVTQFYDAQQTLGTRYAQQTFAGFHERARKSLTDDHWLATALDDRIEQTRPQWDLYMLYAPGVRWEAANDPPPMPTHWIRHLGRKEDRKTSTYWQDTPESGPREGDLFLAIRTMAEQAIGKPQAMQAGPPMKIEILGFDGCPNTPQTKANVENAAASMRLAAIVAYVDQHTLPQDDQRRGWPAPTILVDGRDLFGMSPSQAMALGCRMYPHGGAPTEAEIAAALKSTTVALAPSKEPPSPPMVCTLTPEQLKAQRDALLPGLLKRADERTPLERGYRMKFTPRPGLLDEIARIVEQERSCCQFLKFQITVEPSNGPIYLEVTGPPGTREMLDTL
jgi:hypothetical protein